MVRNSNVLSQKLRAVALAALAVGVARIVFAAGPMPDLELKGYTQVDASNVSFQPDTGATLTINTATDITATSSAKTITQVLLMQTVKDPTDTVMMYATQAPFTISFTPRRLGSAHFGAITAFSDHTYAMTPLDYTLQPGGPPTSLKLDGAPIAHMRVGEVRHIQAYALFPGNSYPIDVTQLSTYAAHSGTTNVFATDSGGTVTATGNGVDSLDVSYNGATASAPIPVGP